MHNIFTLIITMTINTVPMQVWVPGFADEASCIATENALTINSGAPGYQGTIESTFETRCQPSCADSGIC